MFEMWVALEVTDEAAYSAYRAAMSPILEGYGGAFRFDVVVAKTLRGDFPGPINRLFALRFPDAAAKERFFADPAYRKAKDAHFARGARGVAILAEYAS
jgi:uncharacterized protein (DUF1330 family)